MITPRTRWFRWLAAGVGSVVAAAACRAQQPIAWDLGGPNTQVEQQHPFAARLSAQIAPGWHLYAPTQPPGGPVAATFAIEGDTTFIRNGRVTSRAPEVAPDNNFQIVTETFTGSVDFGIPLIARASGARKLGVLVGYQVCTDRYCLPPTKLLLTTDVAVRAGSNSTIAGVVAAPPPSPPSGPPSASAGGVGSSTSASVAPPSPPPVSHPATSNPSGASTLHFGSGASAPAGAPQSLPLLLWLAVAMGALSLLTPCVFPMIPITVSYFTKTREQAHGSPARNALLYAAGIMATFTILGLAIAILVGAGGINRFAANPWINLLVTALFIAFALNLFGWFEIGLPASLVTRLDAASRHAGTQTAGILLMGLTFTLTSFTCTAPFVGTLLVMASGGSWAWPLLGLLVYSAVFAAPFFVLALMPSAVARLPRSGSWLQSVKVVLGFVELATAMKFLSNADLILRWGIFTRSVVLAIWLGIAALTALYLLGLLAWPGHPRSRPGIVRTVLAALTVLVAVYIGRGLSGHRLGELESFVPAPEGSVASGTVAVAGELPWMVNDYTGGLARARTEHALVLIDFTGYTCTNCRWMEANMFPRPAVKSAMADYVRVRLYTDGLGAIYQQQQQMEQDKLGTVALPYYAVVDTLGNVRSSFLGMTRSTDEFVQFLKQGRQSGITEAAR